MNPFQAQYPLSPRKFWKKFLPSIISSAFLSILVGGFSLLFFVFQAPHALVGSAGSAALGTIITSAINVGLGAFGLLVVLNFFYIIAYIKSYYYAANDNFVTIRKNVFTPREINLQYQRIQDVYVDQDLFDRILGLYDVHIETATAASGQAAHIDGVRRDVADGLKNFFLAKIQTTAPNAQQQVPAGVLGGGTNL